MQEQQNEKLSLLIDDQLDSAQSMALLKTVKQDAELQAKLRRYALISQAMKTEQCAVANLDFADRIHQQLKQEPNYLLPRKNNRTVYGRAALAVAASLVLAVVWLSLPTLQKQDNSANLVAQRSLQAEQTNARFKEYLQAHDNVWYVNNNAGVRTYARVASYQQK